jgi:hypothetical protein
MHLISMSRFLYFQSPLQNQRKPGFHRQRRKSKPHVTLKQAISAILTGLRVMNSTTAAAVDWVQAVGNLRFPSKVDHRFQELMDRHNEGLLQEFEERKNCLTPATSRTIYERP